MIGYRQKSFCNTTSSHVNVGKTICFKFKVGTSKCVLQNNEKSSTIIPHHNLIPEQDEQYCIKQLKGAFTDAMKIQQLVLHYVQSLTSTQWG